MMDINKDLWRSIGYYTSSESSDGGKSDFDEDYYSLRPPCNTIKYNNSKMVKIKPNQFSVKEKTKVNKTSQSSISKPIVGLEQLCSSNLSTSSSNEETVKNKIKKRRRKKRKVKTLQVSSSNSNFLPDQICSNNLSSSSDKIIVDNSNLTVNNTNETEEIIIEERNQEENLSECNDYVRRTAKNASNLVTNVILEEHISEYLFKDCEGYSSNLMKNNLLKPPASDKSGLTASKSIDSKYDEFHEYERLSMPMRSISFTDKKPENIHQIDNSNHSPKKKFGDMERLSSIRQMVNDDLLESGNSESSKSDFDEEYYNNRPTVSANYSKRNVMVIRANQFASHEENVSTSSSSPVTSLGVLPHQKASILNDKSLETENYDDQSSSEFDETHSCGSELCDDLSDNYYTVVEVCESDSDEDVIISNPSRELLNVDNSEIDKSAVIFRKSTFRPSKSDILKSKKENKKYRIYKAKKKQNKWYIYGSIIIFAGIACVLITEVLGYILTLIQEIF